MKPFILTLVLMCVIRVWVTPTSCPDHKVGCLVLHEKEVKSDTLYITNWSDDKIPSLCEGKFHYYWQLNDTTIQITIDDFQEE